MVEGEETTRTGSLAVVRIVHAVLVNAGAAARNDDAVSRPLNDVVGVKTELAVDHFCHVAINHDLGLFEGVWARESSGGYDGGATVHSESAV